jgi:hypothetical protein
MLIHKRILDADTNINSYYGRRILVTDYCWVTFKWEYLINAIQQKKAYMLRQFWRWGGEYQTKIKLFSLPQQRITAGT